MRQPAFDEAMEQIDKAEAKLDFNTRRIRYKLGMEDSHGYMPIRKVSLWQRIKKFLNGLMT